MRLSPRIGPNMSVRSSLSTPAIAGYEWVRDDVLKYKSCLTLLLSS